MYYNNYYIFLDLCELELILLHMVHTNPKPLQQQMKSIQTCVMMRSDNINPQKKKQCQWSPGVRSSVLGQAVILDSSVQTAFNDIFPHIECHSIWDSRDSHHMPPPGIPSLRLEAETDVRCAFETSPKRSTCPILSPAHSLGCYLLTRLCQPWIVLTSLLLHSTSWVPYSTIQYPVLSSRFSQHNVVWCAGQVLQTWVFYCRLFPLLVSFTTV